MNDEVFWIREVCDADWRAKLITPVGREWFATRTLEQAIKSYEQKLQMISERNTKKSSLTNELSIKSIPKQLYHK